MTQDIEQLRRARRRLARRFHFRDKELDARYRESKNRLYRIPRAAMFAVIAVFFGAAPLYQDLLFVPAPEVRQLLVTTQLGVVLPLSLAVLAALLLRVRDRVIWRLEILAISVWALSALGYEALGHMALMQNPPELLSLSLVAVAIFCGYRVLHVLIGVTLLSAMSVALSVMLVSDPVQVPGQIFHTFFGWLIALLAAWSLDMLNRAGWLNDRLVRQISRTDPLTGLLNRRAFDEAFGQRLLSAERHGVWVGLAVIDIDHFKSINDRHGHPVGDQVLERVAEALRIGGGQRRLDLVARYGGEEFVLCHYGIEPDGYPRMVEGLLQLLCGLEYPDAGGAVHRITASVGARAVLPEPGIAIPALLSEADALLYRAKSGGRARACLSIGCAPGEAVMTLLPPMPSEPAPLGEPPRQDAAADKV